MVVVIPHLAILLPYVKYLGYILFFIAIFCDKTMAQSVAHSVSLHVPSVAVVDVEGPGGTNSVTLSPSFSGEAGEALDFSSARDNRLWLNYTSVLGTGVNRRDITASMSSSNALPRGMSLRLRVTDPTGTGDVGDAINRTIRLQTSERNVVRQIRNGYTGNGVGNGCQLTYFVRFNNRQFRRLTEMNTAITVTYTMVDK